MGQIGFTVISEQTENGLGHIGYFIGKNYWSKDYTTEAVKRVLEFAFEEIGLHKMMTGAMKENVASERVMIKCDMTKEADFKNMFGTRASGRTESSTEC